jgi:hypothetical protein
VILLSSLLVISYSQLSEEGLHLNIPRKLQSSESETILLGYDNYNFTYDSSTRQSYFNFSIHFLLKNWDYNYSFINDENIIKFNNIPLKAIINYQGDDEGKEVEFNCTKDNIDCIKTSNEYDIYKYQDYNFKYYHVEFNCHYNLTGRGIPKKINITTNFTNSVYLNTSQVSYVSSSVEALERDLISLKYPIFEKMKFLENATFVSQSPNSFKIRGKLNGDRYQSENIQLITNVNGVPKKIPCSGKSQKDSSDDDTYFFVESKGSNNLAGADLRHAILNYTKQSRIAVLSFKEESKESNGTILPPKVAYKKKSGGLSTGGIIAIVIPAVLVLLGIGALAFFLSRRAVPSPPIKNIGNNTMGVVASSEAVVHQ